MISKEDLRFLIDRIIHDIVIRGFVIDEQEVRKQLEDLLSKIELTKHVVKLLKAWSKTMSYDTWGYELEFEYQHYTSFILKYIFYNVIASVVLKGMVDGSGPFEIRSPPMSIHDLDLLKSFVIVVKELEIPFTENERGYDCGRHIHIRPSGVDLYDAFKLLIHVIPWLMPLMASVRGSEDSKYFQFRNRAAHFANPPPDEVQYSEFSARRSYWYITYNPSDYHKSETLEIRLNESSPIEAWAVAYICTKLVNNLELRNFAEQVIKRDYKILYLQDVRFLYSAFTFESKLRTRKGDVKIREVFELIFDKIFEFNEKHGYTRENALLKQIYNNVKNYRKVYLPEDFDKLYGNFLNT